MDQNRNNKTRFQEEEVRRQRLAENSVSLPHSLDDRNNRRLPRDNFSFDPQILSTTTTAHSAQNAGIQRRRNNAQMVDPLRVNLDSTADNNMAEVPHSPNKTPKTPITPRIPPVQKPDTPFLEKIKRQNIVDGIMSETPESPIRTPKTPRSIPNPDKEPSRLANFRQQHQTEQQQQHHQEASYETPETAGEDTMPFEVNHFRF
jgi:hypothetical protein